MNTCLRATSLSNKIFRKLSNVKNFCRSQGAVTSTPWAPGLSSLASIGGFRLKTGHCACCGYILKLMCRCIEQPLLRCCLFGSYRNFTTRPNIFYKKIETFVAPAREVELLKWLKPILAPVRTKMSFAASTLLKCLCLIFVEIRFLQVSFKTSSLNSV